MREDFGHAVLNDGVGVDDAVEQVLVVQLPSDVELLQVLLFLQTTSATHSPRPTTSDSVIHASRGFGSSFSEIV